MMPRKTKEATGQLATRASGLAQEASQVTQNRVRPASAVKCGRHQFSSFILFAGLILLLNLCPPFQIDFEQRRSSSAVPTTGPAVASIGQFQASLNLPSQRQCLSYIEASMQFARLMFRNPMRLDARTTRYMLAEARVLGKMAKVWYIKKKIKKLSKKLKKHTIAVPVFTAIPIYEHSYYPQPHVTHVTHGGGMHHAAASSYAPSVAQVAVSPASSAQTQMATAASNSHPAAYRMAPPVGHHGHHHSPMYHPHGSGSHHIINAYTPSQPLYVDDAGGLYGHYGNAYGRYDGGYHVW